MFYSAGSRTRQKFRAAVNSVINSMFAPMAANTYKANITGSQANPTDASRSGVRGNLHYAPQITTVTTTGAGTYNTPTVNGELPLYLRVRILGGGGGAGGSGTGGGNGNAGSATTFGTGPLFTANGGAQGVNNPTEGTFPAGGTASGGYLNVAGQDGGTAINGAVSSSFGVPGGNSYLSGGGNLLIHTATNAVSGDLAKANSGSGGGASGTSAAVTQASAGAAGGYCEGLITSPAASYSYTVGAKGTGGGAGTSGLAGRDGGDGLLIVEAYWQ